jgi:hypothetical protein
MSSERGNKEAIQAKEVPSQKQITGCRSQEAFSQKQITGS